MTTFQEHKTRTTSEKIVLAWLEPSQRLFTWSVYSGSVYSRTVPYYVVGVRQDATALTQVFSVGAVNSAGKWYFNPTTMTLYVRSIGSVDPGTLWTDVTYRLFFANAPIDLPADLNQAREVPYDARLLKTSKFKERFDPDQKGIALEGTGNLTLHNNDGFFEPIYDRLVWENKACKIFSYARDLPVSEAVTLFDGVITGKDFDNTSVKFDVKNFIYKLRSALDLPLYTEEDGTLPDSLIGKPKRRVYGRVDGLVCEPVSNLRTTYELQTVADDERTGTPITLSLASGSNAATASSATVHADLCAGDTIKVSGNTFKVKSLARVDIGLDTPKDVTLTRPSGTVARLAFTDIDTSGVSAGYHITLAVLSNASTTSKARAIGHFPISTVNASYLEFTLPTSVSDWTDTFKSGVGEIAVTRNSNTTAFTLQQNSGITVSGEEVTVTPVVPYRRFNRTYSIAHHALSNKATTVSAVVSAVKFALADVDGIYVGDIIRINGDELSTITGLDREAKLVTVADVVLPLPTIGVVVERLGIQRVTYKETDFTQFEDFNRDYVTDVGTSITFDTLAEFNVAPEQQLASRVSWYNGSKQVLGSNGVFAGVKPRDWVRSQTEGTWYEVSERFSDNLIILNTPYSGTTGENLTSLKQPAYIADNSVLISEVYGCTEDGTESGRLLVTAADVVRDLMTDAGVEALVDQASFDAAALECPYRLSLALPTTRGGRAPAIRDVINLINDSVIGSLYGNADGTIKYQTLDASRAEEDATLISEADVISSSVNTDSSIIYRKVLVRYAFKDADTVTEKETYSVEQSESDFVLNSGIDGQVETFTTALYDSADADRLAQRLRFMHELAGSQVSVTVKLLLADASLNDLVVVSLDRIYQRLGTTGTDRSKTGLISYLERDGLTCKAVIDDLGNIFNRVGAVTPNDADAFEDASESARRFNGYITDNDGLADDEDTFNSNLIG